MHRLRHVAELRVSNVDTHTREGEQPVRLCTFVDTVVGEELSIVLAVARFRVGPGPRLTVAGSERISVYTPPPMSEFFAGKSLGLRRCSDRRGVNPARLSLRNSHWPRQPPHGWTTAQ